MGKRLASNPLAVLTNVSATILLAALVGLGIFANVNKIIVDSSSYDGISTINVNATYWKVACILVGTAIGILATDDILTRRELGNARGQSGVLQNRYTIYNFR
jgi:hypothetical protein